MKSTIKPKSKFMMEAIAHAKTAQKDGDYAIGAVIVRDDNVIAGCSSRSKRDESPIAHAETLAIIEASKILESRHLSSCVLYTTHEPCPMCASVIVWAKLEGVVYGTRIKDMSDYRESNSSKHYLWRTIDIPCQEIINKSVESIPLVKDFMREECNKLFHC